MTILVIGGTGTVGSKVVEALLGAGVPVRVFSRGRGDWRDDVTPHFRKAGVEIISGDIRDQNRIASAVNGVNGIIHTAGAMQELPDFSLQSVNVESIASLIPIALNAGVQRMVYLGCLGSTQFSNSEYLRTKWEAEQLIRESNFYWTIFRAAPIFALGSQLMRSLEFWVNRFPFIPIIGSGLNEIAPVSATDVATCLMQALYDKDTVGQSYDLVGPHTFTLTELMELTAIEYEVDRKPLIKVPSSLGYQLANLIFKFTPRTPVSADFMRLLACDLDSDPALMKTKFGAPMLPLESQYKRIAVEK